MTKLVDLAKLALLFLPVALFLGGLLLMPQTPDRKRMSLGKAIGRIWALALVLALVFTAGYVVINTMQSGMESRATISLNYAEASRGLNPNGTRFNTYDIIGDEVLEKAIAEGNLGQIAPSQLRAALSVEPLEEGHLSAEHYYVATEYVLRYRATEKTNHLDAQKVVTAVANAYYDNFTQDYSRKSNVLVLDFNRLQQEDYLNQVELLKKYAKDVADYLEMCGDESQSFTHADGETFEALAAKVESLSDVELERLNSFILVNGLTETKNQQLSRLNYLNLIKDISADKNTASYQIYLETISMYERDLATIVLVPTRDDDGEFYMSRTKIGVDAFADIAEDYSKDASADKQDVSTNNYALKQLSQSRATKADYETAEALVQQIYEDLDAYARKGLSMIQEYDRNTTGEQLSVSVHANNPMAKSELMKYAIVLGMLLVSGCVFLGAIAQRKRVHAR